MARDLYYYNRAESELRIARETADVCAARVHFELAGRYLDRFYDDEAPAKRMRAIERE